MADRIAVRNVRYHFHVTPCRRDKKVSLYPFLVNPISMGRSSEQGWVQPSSLVVIIRAGPIAYALCILATPSIPEFNGCAIPYNIRSC